VISEKLAGMGITIPEAPKPLAAYVPAVLSENIVYTAGQLPFQNGVLFKRGKVGSEVTEEEAVKCAEICAINCLSAINTVIQSPDRIEKIIKLTVFISSAPGFNQQPKIANGASEFLVRLFGDSGKHARSAVGVSELPLNAPVEIEMTVRIKK